MAHITSFLMAGALALTGAACANDPTSPTAQFKHGADDPAVQNQGGGAAANKTIMEIILTGAPSFTSAKGKAKFTVKGGQRELEIEVENLNRIAGQSVGFFVGGASVGTGIVSALGQADLELNTRLGHTVPASVAGLAVAVRTADGTLIASGSF